MADSADFVVRYNDFSGGDYGILDPARAKRNQYSGINVIEYNSGLLGVRPGFKTVPVAWPGTSNLDGDISTVPGPLGFDVWGEELVLQLNSRSYGIPISEDPIVPHVLGVYSSPPTEFCTSTRPEGLQQQSFRLRSRSGLWFAGTTTLWRSTLITRQGSGIRRLM
jgi:hypothetical protein